MKTHFIAFFTSLTTLLFCQTNIAYDFDKDGIDDKLELEISDQGERLVANLSSHQKPIHSPYLGFGTQHISLSRVQDVVKLHVGYMRNMNDYQFRYKPSLKTFLLIGYDDEDFGNAANDASGTSSYNLLTGKYIADFYHYDVAKDTLVKLPTVKKQFPITQFQLERIDGQTMDKFWIIDVDSYQEAKIKYLSKQNSQPHKNLASLTNHLKQLMKIRDEDVFQTGIIHKELPHDKGTYVYVIPEIWQESKDITYITSHILLANIQTGSILNYRRKSNEWVSDAMILNKIEIDTAPYIITKNKRAFGIRVSYASSSQVNFYSPTLLSLLLPEENSLSMVLKEHPIDVFTGESDGNCIGEYKITKGIVMIKKSKKDYYPLTIQTTTTHKKTLADANGNCLENTSPPIIKNQVLNFKNRSYQ